MKDEWGLEKPLGVFRVRGDGAAAEEEQIGPGMEWRPSTGGVERAGRAAGHSAVQVDEGTASRLAARWSYSYRRIVDRASGRTVAYARVVISPSNATVWFEESTCASGVWESTRRLHRIEAGVDDYDVETVEAATVEDYLRDLPKPEHRYFAVVKRNGATFGLADPAEVLRIHAAQENGVRERLGPDWMPYDIIDGVRGLRDETLLEIDEAAVAAFRHRRSTGGTRPVPEYTYYAFLHGGVESVHQAQTVVRQWRVDGDVHEDKLSGGPQWVPSDYHGRETRDSDPESVQISAETAEKLKAPWRYRYYEILPPGSDRPMALVRHYGAYGGREEAAVGWPVWSPSLWLKQIAEGKVAYHAREVDADAAERYLRRVLADRPEYRYFAFLDDGDSIDSAGHMARMHCLANGTPWKEETPQRDGGWAQTFSLLEIHSGKGSWWKEPVEVPQWLFERYRAKRQGKARTE
ncbi:hypothetical protein OHA21_17465 [Actinoplanes sp. NBC_00393]|uniref:hypothetical protein n=1 Tax=Actinoplanes sp. NBC_00393 TaxID=2975953 RepID=UPI002E1B1022